MSPQIVESERRCGNYAPKVWTDEFMQSQTSVYLDQKYLEQAAKLKESVRGMLETTATKPLEQLELIDALQRLGMSRHFTHEINNILASMHVMITSNHKQPMNDSLYETALQFRLLRQEGFQIAQEMFNSFMCEEGSFDVKHCGDIKGVLSLYEASYLSMEDEDVLEKAKDFSVHHLKQALQQEIDQNLGEQLAKLDYNMVQAIHLDELKQLSRRISTKSAEIITVIDDVCDVYATLNEVETLTDAVNRWDVSAIEGLPNYLKICFLALFNYVNEVVYDILQQQDFNILPYIQKVWSDLCRTYLVEAKWFNEGVRPRLKEFLENALVSVGGPLLMDELERGDTPKSIQCYMHEAGCSEEDARKYIHKMVETTWKKMNKHILSLTDSNFSKDFIRTALNFARISQCMYQYGDGYGRPQGITKDRINSLFFHPIPLPPYSITS
nr:(-)-alpha-terpineol synthase-like [Ipomoea trifida]